MASFKLIFENVNIGLNLGMTKRTFKMRFFKSSDAFRCIQMHLSYLNNAGSNDCPVSSK